MKPGDLVRVIESNSVFGGRIGIIVTHPVIPPTFTQSDPIFEASAVLLESELIDWIASEWLEVISCGGLDESRYGFIVSEKDTFRQEH